MSTEAKAVAVTPPHRAAIVVGQALVQTWVDAAARDLIHKAALDAMEIAAEIEAVEVLDTGGAARVTEHLTLAASTLKRVDEARRSITDPLKRRAKDIEDAVRPLTQALERLIDVGKSKVITWQRAERERVEAERRERERVEAAAIAEAQAKAASEQRPVAVAMVPPPVQDAPRGVRTDYGSASLTQTWDFEIMDPEQVPRAFLSVNEQAIRGAVRGGARSIPGVRIFQKDGIAVRAR